MIGLVKHTLLLLCICAFCSCFTSNQEGTIIPISNGDQPLLKAAERTEPDSIEIRFGSSFGMCEGYCKYEYKLQSWGLDCSRIGWDSVAYPSQHQTVEVSRTNYQNIVRTVDNTDLWSEFKSVTIGCPDCADGGRCWIEVRQGDELKRFDYDCVGGPEPHRDFVDLVTAVAKDVRWW